MAKLNTKNPFEKGVTYEAFLANVKGKVTVDSLIKDLKLDQDSENWLKEELNNYKNK
jgi:hypothetical protein